MAWRTVLTVLVVVFVIGVVQIVLLPPAQQTIDALNDSGDYDSSYLDGNSFLDNVLTDWMNMGLIGMFGAMLWGGARVLRKEITRGRRR